MLQLLEIQRGQFTISTDLARLDINAIIDADNLMELIRPFPGESQD